MIRFFTLKLDCFICYNIKITEDWFLNFHACPFSRGHCHLKGKKIIPFATSGGSGMGNTNKGLKPSCVEAELLEGKRFSEDVSEATLTSWVSSLNC